MGPKILIMTFVIGCVVQARVGVKINKLHVPAVVKVGTPLILDCDFSLDAGEQDLVVKWFFQNQNRTLVYQWIPGSMKSPQDSGVLKGRLDLTYEIHEAANQAHRALFITKPGPDLSGDYTCSVSTWQSEDEQTKTMLVFVPEKNLSLKILESDGKFTKIKCTAEGVFPKPKLTLQLPESGDISDTQVDVQQHGLLFDINTIGIIHTPTKPTDLICQLHIVEANYTRVAETVILSGVSLKRANNLVMLIICYINWRLI